MRTTNIYLLVLLLTCGFVRGAWGTDANYDDFARYSDIITRAPFGKEPQRLEEIKRPAVAPSWYRVYKLTALIDMGPSGLRAGLLNSKSRATFLSRTNTEVEDGIMVMDIDYDAEATLLQKGDDKRWLYMDGKGVGAPASRSGSRSSGRGVVRPVTSTVTKADYAQRMIGKKPDISQRQRMAGVDEVFRSFSKEELKADLQHYQMDLIRAGGEAGPALPMRLTPEMDQQLVNEGVLSPLEDDLDG